MLQCVAHQGRDISYYVFITTKIVPRELDYRSCLSARDFVSSSSVDGPTDAIPDRHMKCAFVFDS